MISANIDELRAEKRRLLCAREYGLSLGVDRV